MCDDKNNHNSFNVNYISHGKLEAKCFSRSKMYGSSNCLNHHRRSLNNNCYSVVGLTNKGILKQPITTKPKHEDHDEKSETFSQIISFTELDELKNKLANSTRLKSNTMRTMKAQTRGTPFRPDHPSATRAIDVYPDLYDPEKSIAFLQKENFSSYVNTRLIEGPAKDNQLILRVSHGHHPNRPGIPADPLTDVDARASIAQIRDSIAPAHGSITPVLRRGTSRDTSVNRPINVTRKSSSRTSGHVPAPAVPPPPTDEPELKPFPSPPPSHLKVKVTSTLNCASETNASKAEWLNSLHNFNPVYRPVVKYCTAGQKSSQKSIDGGMEIGKRFGRTEETSHMECDKQDRTTFADASHKAFYNGRIPKYRTSPVVIAWPDPPLPDEDSENGFISNTEHHDAKRDAWWANTREISRVDSCRIGTPRFYPWAKYDNNTLHRTCCYFLQNAKQSHHYYKRTGPGPRHLLEAIKSRTGRSKSEVHIKLDKFAKSSEKVKDS